MPLVIFPIFTNLFYLINILFAFKVGWYKIGFLYIGVFLTSSMYHFCENVNICDYGWGIQQWRILDHIMAWYALVSTPIYGINPEAFPTKTHSNKKDGSKNGHYKKMAKNHFKYYKTIKFGTYELLLNFFDVLLLTQIVYFSNNLIDDVLVPQIVILSTLVLALIVPRIVLYLTHKYLFHGNMKKSFIFFGNAFNSMYLVYALVLGILAAIFFILKEDKQGIFHGLWHLFGSLTGTVFIISIYVA